jgi:hypothetical protein
MTPSQTPRVHFQQFAATPHLAHSGSRLQLAMPCLHCLPYPLHNQELVTFQIYVQEEPIAFHYQGLTNVKDDTLRAEESYHH